MYPDGVERSRIGAVVDAGLCHVLLCSGKQFLFGSSHQPKFGYLLGIPTRQYILVTFWREQHFIRQGTAVVFILYNLPKLGIRIPCAVVVLFGQTKRIKSYAELHAVELTGLELDFEFLTLKNVFLREAYSGISKTVEGSFSIRAILVVHLTFIRAYIGNLPYPLRIYVVEYNNCFDSFQIAQPLAGVYVWSTCRKHKALLNDAINDGTLVYRAIVGRDVARWTERIDSCGISTLAVTPAHVLGFLAKFNLNSVGELTASEVDYMVRYPTVTAPFLCHAKHGVNEVHVLISHQLWWVLYTAVNGKREILSSISITKSFQIAKEYTHLDIQWSGKGPGRFQSSVLRGVLEYLCFPLEIVSVKTKFIGVASVLVGRIGNIYNLIDFCQFTAHGGIEYPTQVNVITYLEIDWGQSIKR